MKIKNVECIVLDGGKPYQLPKNSEEAVGVRYVCLLKVETDEGIIGWSNIETQPHVAHAAVNAPISGSECFEVLKNIVVGEDPFDVEKLWNKIYKGTIYYGRRGVAIQVLSGFDIACWDIMGKATGKPIYKLLGGAYRNKVRAYASTLFRSKPEDMKTACHEYIDQGFTAVKFGYPENGRELNVDLVAAAREVLGDRVDLLIDLSWMGYNRSPYDAITLCKKLEPYNIYFLEDFLHPENYEGYAKVSKKVNIRIAAGEHEATPWGFKDLIERGKVDIIQPDLSRCGGFTAFRKIVWMAELNNVDIIPHAWLTNILTAASLHANASLQKSHFLEYNVSSNPMLNEIVKNPICMKDGFLNVREKPGLGIEIDEKAIEKYRVL